MPKSESHRMSIINKGTMKNEVKFYRKLVRMGIEKREEVALNTIRQFVKNEPILDLGVGGGRTVEPLLEISNDYVGIDYVKEMVECCVGQYPNVRIEQGDACDLSRFKDESFAMVMFSLNGICMVDHEGRLKILNEVYRVLRPNGFFLFSTYNAESYDYKKLFRFPEVKFSANPAKLFVRGMRAFKDTILSIPCRIRYKKTEIVTPEYSIINDRCHNYSTMLYYITHENQIKQLKKNGFNGKIHSFDYEGRPIEDKTLDDSIFYVAQK